MMKMKLVADQTDHSEIPCIDEDRKDAIPANIKSKREGEDPPDGEEPCPTS